MKIVVASDSFKGSLTSRQIGDLVKRAAQKLSSRIQIRVVEVADGGDGTVDAFFSAVGKSRRRVSVQGPMGAPLDAEYCTLQDGTAVIEAASVVGLAQHKDCFDPLRASSYGVGQMMAAALLAGHEKLIIGLGGSCTTDGGIGLAAALGFSFLDKDNKPVEISPKGLAHVASIGTTNVVPAFWNAEIIFACDVTNPFYGPQGAASVFAPQKGASPPEVQILDSSLRRFAHTIQRITGVDLQEVEGTGAAGGMGSIPLAFGKATLCPGLDLLLQAVNFDALISDADLIITGEGRLDSQSLKGKVPLSIARRGKQAQKPVIAIVGTVEAGLPDLQARGISEVFVISPETATLEENIKNCAENYCATVSRILQSDRWGSGRGQALPCNCG